MCTFFNRDKLATTHKRLLRLRNAHGWAGYGIYYRILELMVYDDDHYLDNDMALLAMALGLRTAKERAMLEDILYRYDLFAFTEDETEFYSPSLMHKEEAILEDNLKNGDTILTDNLKNEDEILKPNLKKRSYNLRDEKRAILRENAKNARQSKKSNLKNDDAILTSNLKNEPQILTDNLKNDNANLKNEAPNLNETPDLGGNKKGGLSCSLEGIGENNLSSKAINEEKESPNNFLKDRGCGGKETNDPPHREEQKPPHFTPPTLPEVEARCHEMNYPTGTAEAFHSYQVASGWRVGRKPMQDWHRALAYWVSRARQIQGRGTSSEANTLSPAIATLPEVVEMRLAFEAYYRERTALSFCWSEREHKALSELRDKLRQGLTDEGLAITPQAITQNFRHFLSLISDPWILKNLSPHILNTKYNEIRSTYATCRATAQGANPSLGISPLRELLNAANATIRKAGS